MLRVNLLAAILMSCILSESSAYAQIKPCESEDQIPEPLTYESIKKAIETKHFKDSSDLIACLPLSYRKNFALGYLSASPEKDDVDYQHPRVLMFGKNADPVIAFTGKEGTESFNKIQIKQRHGDVNDFYEIDFGRGDKRADFPNFLSHRDPGANCVSCHSNDQHNLDKLMPIWADYNFWPGFYQSSDGTYLKPNVNILHLRASEFAHTKISKEAKELLKFNSGNASNRESIYSTLEYDKSSPDGPFLKDPSGPGDELPGRVNFKLNLKLALQEANKMFVKITKSPNFERFKYALVAALWSKADSRFSSCPLPESSPDNLSKFLLNSFDLDSSDFSLAHPMDKKSPGTYDVQVIEELTGKKVAQMSKEDQSLIGRIVEHRKSASGYNSPDGGSGVLSHLVGQLISRIDEGEKQASHGKNDSISEHLMFLNKESLKKEEDHSDYPHSKVNLNFEDDGVLCQYLKSKISQEVWDEINGKAALFKLTTFLSNLSTLYSQHFCSYQVTEEDDPFVEISSRLGDPEKGQVLFHRCLGCHKVNGLGHKFTQDDYAKKIRESVRAGRMPPNSHLKVEELRDFEAYLDVTFKIEIK